MKVNISKIERVVKGFSLVEKVIFFILAFFLIWSAFMFFYSVMDAFRKDSPMRGGELHEGVVGYPSFINPILSTTNSGRDLSYLIYSGLMRIDEKGELQPDLAESHTVSPDGTEYTFILRNGVAFHDGTPLTSADVVFTVEAAKNPSLKSPAAANWQGVTVSAPDSRTVVFTLKTPYMPFIENTALGILPKHIWDTADLAQFTFSPYNFSPIGSGPYKVAEISKNAAGSPYLYELSAWSDYAPGEKNISTLYFHIYPDEAGRMAALRKGEVESAGDLSPADAQLLKNAGFDIRTTDLFRVFGVFFNQNQATLFTDKIVRQALDKAVDRNRIIDTVLLSYGNEEDSPLPSSDSRENDDLASTTEQANSARALLSANGWKANSDGIMEKKDTKGTRTLSFTLTTSDNPELMATASLLKEQWGAIGADVVILSLGAEELADTAIRPRKYDALLFGEVTGRGEDLYPFWYSGERRDPGLNIAQYTNGKADTLLQDARTATSSAETADKLSAFVDIIREDVPTVFLYSPDFIYTVPKKLRGLELPTLEMSHERLSGILSSYIKTRRVWK